jgi:hypothetical protein
MRAIATHTRNKKTFEASIEIQKAATPSAIATPVSPGAPLTAHQFKELILNRENGPGITLKKAKAKWAEKRNQLMQLVR